MLRVEVFKQLGEFSIEASFSSEGRVTGLFGASGAGKTSLINMIAGWESAGKVPTIFTPGSILASVE